MEKSEKEKIEYKFESMKSASILYDWKRIVERLEGSAESFNALQDFVKQKIPYTGYFELLKFETNDTYTFHRHTESLLTAFFNVLADYCVEECEFFLEESTSRLISVEQDLTEDGLLSLASDVLKIIFHQEWDIVKFYCNQKNELTECLMQNISIKLRTIQKINC